LSLFAEGLADVNEPIPSRRLQIKLHGRDADCTQNRIGDSGYEIHANPGALAEFAQIKSESGQSHKAALSRTDSGKDRNNSFYTWLDTC
jgi:hypothetical protein